MLLWDFGRTQLGVEAQKRNPCSATRQALLDIETIRAQRRCLAYIQVAHSRRAGARCATNNVRLITEQLARRQ